jgi:F-type H+-transporting ATPase subunit b
MNINLTLLMQAAIFALFIWACAKYIWPVLMRAIETRQTQIADGLAAGEEGRHALANAEKRIAEMMNDAKTRAQEIVAQGEKLKTETIEQSKSLAVEGDRLLLRPGRSSRKSIAPGSVARLMAQLAVAGAEQILARSRRQRTPISGHRKQLAKHSGEPKLSRDHGQQRLCGPGTPMLPVMNASPLRSPPTSSAEGGDNPKFATAEKETVSFDLWRSARLERPQLHPRADRSGSHRLAAGNPHLVPGAEGPGRRCCAGADYQRLPAR